MNFQKIFLYITNFLRLDRSNCATEKLLECAYGLAQTEWEVAPIQIVEKRPLISFVVPVYNTPKRYLRDLIGSFKTQGGLDVLTELILSDDGSDSLETLNYLKNINHTNVKIILNETNQGIATATNRGIENANGEWIAFIDHDDALAPYAIDRLARALSDFPSSEFFYTDEIITDQNLRPIDVFLKPAWDPILLSGVNYINHLSIYRRNRLIALGGVRTGFDGSQDYDVLLRYTKDLSKEQIKHIPYPTYLWRRTEKSFSATNIDQATSNARRAISESYSSNQIKIEVSSALSPDLHRIRFDKSITNWPLVSIIIPTKDHYGNISTLLNGLENTNYPNFEIILVDNGSTEPKVLKLYDKIIKKGKYSLKIIYNRDKFNFSRLINEGLEYATGELILFLNNDIEVQEENWLREMVSCFSYQNVGIVGAKLIYPNQRLQHVGVIVGYGGLAGHWYVGEHKDFPGPQGRLRVRNSFSAVTGACLLTSKKCIDAVGLLDEKLFAIAYNDVDFCIRAIKNGFRIIWTPFATLVHHESVSRGSDETPENNDRFNREKQNLNKSHKTEEYYDSSTNPWLSRDRSHPHPIMLTTLPKPR